MTPQEAQTVYFHFSKHRELRENKTLIIGVHWSAVCDIFSVGMGLYSKFYQWTKIGKLASGKKDIAKNIAWQYNVTSLI